MTDYRSYPFSSLEAGDELLLHGDDIEAGAIVLKVHPFELVLHWLDMNNHDARQMHLLGSHTDVDRTAPFAARFMPGELLVGSFILMVPGTSDDPALEQLGYLRVTRRGSVVFEAGKPNEPETTAAS